MTQIAPRPRAWGTTLFCDDIRQEVQGTVTLVGMYQGAIFINHSFPVTLPKLTLLVKILEDPSNPFVRDGILKVYLPNVEEAVFEMTIAFSQRALATLFSGQENSDKLDKTLLAQIPIVFSPLQISGEGSIRVRLYVEDVEYRVGAVVIKQGSISVDSTVSPQQP